jgi:cytochrome c biogenesis protein CcdA
METTTTPRIEQFKSDIAEMKLKTGTSSKEGALQALGVLMMLAGIVIAFASYGASLNVEVGAGDVLDANSYLIFAVGGLALTVMGAAMFLRYSLAKFLRFWLLRQMYEGQAHIDQVVEAVRER